MDSTSVTEKNLPSKDNDGYSPYPETRPGINGMYMVKSGGMQLFALWENGMWSRPIHITAWKKM
jgi:hypothetical protein